MTDAKRIKQTSLFRSIQLIRLQNDLKLVNDELDKNRTKPIKASDNFIKKAIMRSVNETKDYKSYTLSKTKAAIEAEVAKFSEKFCGTDATLYQEWDIASTADEVFSDDEYLLEKTMFSISLIFDNEFHYEYDDEGLSEVSRLLWGNNKKLASIKKDVERCYKDLAYQPWSTEQKLVFGGIAALTLFTVTVPALVVGGLSATGITSTLAGLGGTMVEGVGFIALAEFLLDGAIIGFTYALLEQHQKNEVKKSFREKNYNEAAQMLAIKCYIMQVAKDQMPKPLFKEKISELLQMISDLKSDTDYVLLVEGENVEENKKKINVFHNLDTKLVKMLRA